MQWLLYFRLAGLIKKFLVKNFLAIYCSKKSLSVHRIGCQNSDRKGGGKGILFFFGWGEGNNNSAKSLKPLFLTCNILKFARLKPEEGKGEENKCYLGIRWSVTNLLSLTSAIFKVQYPPPAWKKFAPLNLFDVYVAQWIFAELGLIQFQNFA